jgi:hypothetical protein
MSRLEAVPDGVIAVIITIVVLDLKAPETPQPTALLRLWPSFATYLVSFVIVAIYWINHHNLLASAGGVTARLIWANNLLLFCLSAAIKASSASGAESLRAAAASSSCAASVSTTAFGLFFASQLNAVLRTIIKTHARPLNDSCLERS